MWGRMASCRRLVIGAPFARETPILLTVEPLVFITMGGPQSHDEWIAYCGRLPIGVAGRRAKNCR